MRKILISIGVLISLLWSFSALGVEDNPNTISNLKTIRKNEQVTEEVDRNYYGSDVKSGEGIKLDD